MQDRDQSATGQSPFLGSTALHDGLLTTRMLYRDFDRVFQDVYISKAIELDTRSRAEAAWLFSRGNAVLSGYSAAALHKTKWLPDDEPPELIWPRHRRQHTGLVVRTDKLPKTEIMTVAGRRVTTPARTAMDLGRRLEPDDAITVIDALCNATSLKSTEISTIVDAHPGARGIAKVRRILEFIDGGAESPQETRARLMLIRAGLPKPATQIEIRDEFGYVFARCDMGWEEWKVAIEYDGKQHWASSRQRAWDIDRAHLLENLGWQVVRMSARQLSYEPGKIVQRARQKLLAAGAPLDLLPRSPLCDLAA